MKNGIEQIILEETRPGHTEPTEYIVTLKIKEVFDCPVYDNKKELCKANGECLYKKGENCFIYNLYRFADK